MADKKGGDNAPNEDGFINQEQQSDTNVDRRNYLKLTAAGVTTLGGLGLAGNSASAATSGGPPNSDNWQLSFEDTFDAGSLDTSKWEVGYGWGLTDRNSAGQISSDEVNVNNGQLHLSVTYDGEITTSGVNTKNLHSYGPGSYWEASIKLPGRTGILPAFWSKPNTEEWPPEIDFIEIFQNDGGHEDTHRAEYHVHYSTSTEPDDSSTHDSLDVEHDASNDLTEGFHVYGCRWLDDRVDFYFDDIHVGSITDSTAMEALRNGGPQYMMLTNMVDKVGTTDKSEHWTEEMVVDWVRVWEGGSDTTSGDSTTDDSTTDDSTTDDSTSDDTTEHYFWVRSGDNNSVTYAFEASGGNISIDEAERASGEDDEWIANDGYTAGGVEDNSGGDGFRYTGEITDLNYDGSIETYIDDQYVDPSTLVDSSKPGPEKPSDSTDDSTDDSTSDSTNDSSLPNTITFEGNSGSTSYSVTVSDAIEPTSSLESDDSISGTTAKGTVGTDTDSYAFGGEITELRTDGDADVLVNGTKVNLVVISRNSDSNGSVKYILETSGQLFKARTSSASINAYDEINGGRAFGRVMGGNDAYWVVGGDIIDVSTFGGDVVTEVDGTVVDHTD